MQAWEQALDLRTETWEWWNTDIGHRFGHNWSSLRKRSALPTPAPVDQVERTKLLLAAPFYVTEEMVDLLDHAQQSFPATPLRNVDLPTHAGFVLLARPMEVTDLHGETLYWQAFSWGIATGSNDPESAIGIHLSLYAHRENDPARVTAEAASGSFPTLALIHETAWTFDHDYAGGDGWETGTTVNEDVPISDEAMASGVEMLRTIHTFFILSWQKIATPQPSQASRAVRKRAMQRIDRGREIPDVRVVTLRRSRQRGESDPEHGSVEWSHRWIVGGFWRRQWYPTEQRHKPKYIAPYEKGPKDKPLVLKKKTYLWRR